MALVQYEMCLLVFRASVIGHSNKFGPCVPYFVKSIFTFYCNSTVTTRLFFSFMRDKYNNWLMNQQNRLDW